MMVQALFESYTVGSLYASGTSIFCRAYTERHIKLTSMLAAKLTCTETENIGPEDLVPIS